MTDIAMDLVERILPHFWSSNPKDFPHLLKTRSGWLDVLKLPLYDLVPVHTEKCGQGLDRQAAVHAGFSDALAKGLGVFGIGGIELKQVDFTFEGVDETRSYKVCILYRRAVPAAT